MPPVTQKSTLKTNTRAGSICKVDVEPVKFADLWAAYPSGAPVDKKHETEVKDANGKILHKKGDLFYQDQCAARVSVAIHGVGVEMKSFGGFAEHVNGKKAAMRAQELANWLKKQPFCGLPQKPEAVTGKDWQEKIKGRTGIIFFSNYWQRSGESAANRSGDHIDLWNGTRLTTGSGGLAGVANNIGRFLFGMETGPGWSDLGKSTEILFWEIK
jgi:hypothetical protein